MKIAFVLTPGAVYGGTFVQALADIALVKEASPAGSTIEIFALNAGEADIPASIGLPIHRLRFGVLDRLIASAPPAGAVRRAVNRFRVVGGVETRLIRAGVDLVVFSEPHWFSSALQELNSLVAIHDVCHRDFPEFPEATTFGRSRARDALLQAVLTRTIGVLVDSAAMVARLQSLYGFPAERCIVRPFSVSGTLLEASGSSFAEVARKYQLQEGYLFYPAQFWPHKNHIRLLQALVLLRDAGHEHRLVLVGDDKGNLPHVRSFISRHGLDDRVQVLGFVPAAEMRALYAGAAALVMPTYFGPTNIPPYEAWALGKPVVYSSHLASQVGDAALLADPDSAEDWAGRIRDLGDPSVSGRLVEAGKARSIGVEADRREALANLRQFLSSFGKRRETWPVTGTGG